MKWLGALSSLLFCTVSLANTHHVPSDYATIQAAVSASADGDTVLVAAGVYAESIAFGGRSITLRSVSGASATTIQHPPGGSQPVISLNGGSDSTTLIDGFSINGGDAVRCVSGSGVSPTVRNCIIEHGYVYRDGGGIFFENGAPLIQDNVLRNNRTNITGAAIFVRLGYGYGTARVVRNVCYDNESPNAPAIGMIQGEGGVIERNVAYHNSTVLPSIARGAIYVWAENVKVWNNTLAHNSLGMTIVSATDVDARNNIIVNHPLGGFELRDDVGANVNITYDYNDVWSNGGLDYLGGSPAAHDLSADPEFVDSANGDLNILSSSPCIDAGDPDPSFFDPNQSRNDMGALPAGNVAYPLATALTIEPSLGSGVVTSLTPDISWIFFDTGLTAQVAYEVEVGTDANWDTAEMWSTGVVTSSAGLVAYAGTSLVDYAQYYLRVRVYNGFTWGAWRHASFQVHVGTAIFVPADALTIQAAIDMALAGDTILVSAGLYRESINFQGKSLVLKSEEGAARTTIQRPAGGVAPVVTLPAGSDASTLIDGFTLDGGNTVRCVSSTGSSPTIQHCIVEYGYVYRDGGGMFLEHGAPTVQDNIVRYNRTQITGGGIFVRLGNGYGTARLINNRCYGNTAPNGPAIGMIQGEGGHMEGNVIYGNTTVLPSIARGAVYVWADNVELLNNTVDGNSLGLTIMSASNVDARNNIISNNPLGGFELREDVGANQNVSYDYNDVWNNGGADYLSSSPAAGDLSADPAYYGALGADYYLRLFSPCVDAGDPTPPYDDSDGSRNDMGAFELDLSGLPVAAGLHLEPSSGLDLISATVPTVHWSYYDTASAAQQTMYQAEIDSEGDWSGSDHWTTGPVSSSADFVAYSGPPLQDGFRYVARVKVAGGAGWGAWQEYSFLIQTSTCGNGVVEPGEECDDGNLVAGDGCDPLCDTEPMVCGNGVLEPGEECDDGNLRAGDGCDPLCQSEPGYCGNGILEFGEDCDDGNLVNGDGCDQYCNSETAVCGNGILEPGEECDDGNLTDGDGCDAQCQSESAPQVELRVGTDTGNDTLMLGVTGALVFSVVAPADQDVAAFAFPLRYGFSNGNIIGPVAESGGGAYVGYSAKSDAAFEVKAWNSIWGGTATDPDTTLLGLIDFDFSSWTGSGELWRLIFTPLDTGTIFIDSVRVPPGVSLELVDRNANNVPFTWTGKLITVVDGYATGDADGNLAINSADVISLVNHTFKGGPPPAECSARGDVNCSGTINATDIVRLINYVFKAGSQPCNAGGLVQDGVWNCP